MSKDDAFNKYKSYWNKKTRLQVEKELRSMQAYVQKHSSYYSWHGAYCTPPDCISDGEKVLVLKEILRDNYETSY